MVHRNTKINNVLLSFQPSLLSSITVVFIISIICFVNSANHEFVFDDSEALIRNKDVVVGHDSVPLFDIFLHDFWGSRLASNSSHKSYRPLTVLTFRINYWLAGGLLPRGFHVVNIVLHGIVSATLVVFISLLLGDGRSFTCSGQFIFQQAELSTLCGVLFAVHPVHTESVAGVVGRADLLSALCFLLSFIFYVKAIYSDVWWLKIVCCVMMTLLVVCSVLFKEPGITVLAVCGVYDVVVVARFNPFSWFHVKHKLNFGPHNGNMSQMPKHLVGIRASIVRVGWLGGLVVILLLCRWRLMGSSTPTFQLVDNPHSFINTTIFRALNYNYLYAINTWLLLCPVWLCFDWSMGCIPVITTATDLRLLAVLLLWLVVIAMFFTAVFCLRDTQQRQLLLAWSLIVFPFLPASNLLFTVGFVIAERNLYLPSIGFILLVTLGLQRLTNRLPCKVVAVCFLFLVATNISRCIQRSAEWKNEKILFESGLDVCPLNAKVHYNVAKIHADLGNIDFAIEKYKDAIRLNRDYDQALNNLGNIYKDKGQLVDAQRLLTEAITVRPEFAAAWMNLAIVQAAQKQYIAAEHSYHMALLHRRRYPDCYYNLGNMYLDQERYSEALSAWFNATSQRPTHVSAWTNAIILLGNLGRYKELHSVLSESVRHNPHESSFHFHFASSLGRAGQFEDSERQFRLAIEKARSNNDNNSNIASYYANLGVLYHRWGKLSLAEESYNIAVELDPTNKQTADNIRLLHAKKQSRVTTTTTTTTTT